MSKSSSSSSKGKTVYVLGAGFSVPAGGPNQAELLKHILSTKPKDKRTADCLTAIRAFLEQTLNVDIDKAGDLPLEDIYTPIDRCLNDGISLRGKTQEELLALRGQIEFLISKTIGDGFKKPGKSSDYVAKLAKYLVQAAKERSSLALKAKSGTKATAYDPFSIISLNWDILLDCEIHDALAKEDGGKSGLYDPIGVVDYCCYVSSLDESDDRIRPGLLALGAKGYNVKLLKIHGSMNWLQCPNCQRVFVGFEDKLILPNYVNPTLCRQCANHSHQSTLRGTLVMPTFLKDLSNFQLKLVWQNAGVELMEARHLVFIGYSLPQADFEFRQLLSRMVHKKAKIDVVLYDDGTPNGTKKYQDECQRFTQFFSGHKVDFEPGGVITYVNKLVP